MSWETKLAEMKGKVLDYQGQDCHVLSYELAGDTVTILTNLDDYEVPLAELDEFLQGFTPPVALATRSAGRVKQTGPVRSLTLAATPALQQMQQALMDALNKVQHQPAFIPQARAVTSLVQAGINLAKVELAAMALTNQLH